MLAETATASKESSDEWTRSWLQREIVKGIELLPPEQRQVFVMHELEGKSFKQIAAETGVSVNTLLSRKRYAVYFLLRRLKDIYEDFLTLVRS